MCVFVCVYRATLANHLSDGGGVVDFATQTCHNAKYDGK